MHCPLDCSLAMCSARGAAPRHIWRDAPRLQQKSAQQKRSARIKCEIMCDSEGLLPLVVQASPAAFVCMRKVVRSELGARNAYGRRNHLQLRGGGRGQEALPRAANRGQRDRFTPHASRSPSIFSTHSDDNGRHRGETDLHSVPQEQGEEGGRGKCGSTAASARPQARASKSRRTNDEV